MAEGTDATGRGYCIIIRLKSPPPLLACILYYHTTLNMIPTEYLIIR